VPSYEYLGLQMSSHSSDGIGWSTLSVTLVLMSIVIIMSFIKIKLSNEIYYESRETNKIEARVVALRQEGKILKMKLEQLRYRVEIVDTIFSIDDNDAILNGKPDTSEINND